MSEWLLESTTGDIPNVDAETHPFTAALPKLALGVHSHKSQSSTASMVWTARPACLHAVSDPLLSGACA